MLNLKSGLAFSLIYKTTMTFLVSNYKLGEKPSLSVQVVPASMVLPML